MLWLNLLLRLANPSSILAYHEVRFEKATRYYVLRLEKDLLDDWVLITINGRRKSNLGQSRTHAFCSFNEAWEQLTKRSHLRMQRGYALYHYKTSNSLFFFLFLLTIQASLTRSHHVDKPSQHRVKKQVPRHQPAASIEISHAQLGFHF